MEYDDEPIDELIAKGYELINGEYIRKVSLLRAAEVENFVEKDVVRYFGEIGYKINRVPKGLTKTVDYEYEHLGIEVTALHDYLPRINDIDSLVTMLAKERIRICAYMFRKDNHQIVRILNKKLLTCNTSVLCLRQHISCYKPKILQKIIDKYIQDEQHPVIIVIIDFRLAHFDSLSLKREIIKILDEFGAEFLSLGGVLISVPKCPDSEMFDRPQYVFVRNKHCTVEHEILRELDNYSLTTTDKRITFIHIFIRYSGLSSVKSPCMDCPDKDWLDHIGLPTF
jgi:hypothetical protein